MTVQTKVKIMLTITISIGIAVFFMWDVPVPRTSVMIIWLCLMIYFGVVVKRKV